MKTALALFLVAALIGCAIALPGYLLDRQEAMLYQTVTQTDALYTQFEVTDSTLAQRLNAAAETFIALDFSAGARLYWDEAEMLARFMAELDSLTQRVPALTSFTAWVKAVVNSPASAGNLYDGNWQLQYLCAVDASTGQTYLFGRLELLADGWVQILMDLPSEKLVSVQCDMPQIYQEAGAEAPEVMADGYAQYLGMENQGLDNGDGRIGIFRFRTSEEETVLAGVWVKWGYALVLSLGPGEYLYSRIGETGLTGFAPSLEEFYGAASN